MAPYPGFYQSIIRFHKTSVRAHQVSETCICWHKQNTTKNLQKPGHNWDTRAHVNTFPDLLGQLDYDDVTSTNTVGNYMKSKRPLYLFQCLLLPPRHNSRVPPFLHSASGLCSIVLLPHSCLTEQGTGAGGPETGYWAAESTPDLARPGNTQWVQSQPSHWHLHGSVT